MIKDLNALIKAWFTNKFEIGKIYNKMWYIDIKDQTIYGGNALILGAHSKKKFLEMID